MLQRCFNQLGLLVGRWRLVSASTTTTTTTSSVSKLLYKGTLAAYRRLLKINNQHGANSVCLCVCPPLCVHSQSERRHRLYAESKQMSNRPRTDCTTNKHKHIHTHTHFKLRSNRPLSSSQQKHSLTYTKATHTQLLMMVMVMMMMMMRWLALKNWLLHSSPSSSQTRLQLQLKKSPRNGLCK